MTTTKEFKITVSAWIIYTFFLGWYVLAFHTGHPFLVKNAAIVVNFDLWAFTFLPAILTAGPVIMLRENFSGLRTQLAAQGGTSGQLDGLAKFLRPRLTKTNVLAVACAALSSFYVFQLGFVWQAAAMMAISLVCHGILVFYPLPRLDAAAYPR